MGGSEHRNTAKKILPNTASPQEKSLDHRHRNIYFQSDDLTLLRPKITLSDYTILEKNLPIGLISGPENYFVDFVLIDDLLT